MLTLPPQPDKRSIDQLAEELIAQGFGRGELAAHLRRVAHRLLLPVQTERRVADLRLKRAKLTGEGIGSQSGEAM